jgi:hypothetical protein
VLKTRKTGPSAGVAPDFIKDKERMIVRKEMDYTGGSGSHQGQGTGPATVWQDLFSHIFVFHDPYVEPILGNIMVILGILVEYPIDTVSLAL